MIEQLFTDDDLAEMYCPDKGRPSLPPALMSGILLLQFYDNVSDAEAVARLEFHLRWKVALTLALNFDPPHPTSLSVCRGRLLEHGQERYAFNQLLAVGRAVGFLPEKITVLIDTTPQLGRCGPGRLHPDPQRHPARAEGGCLCGPGQTARVGRQPGGVPGE